MPYKINTAVPNFTIGNFIKISDGSTVTTGTVTATRTVAGSSAPCSGTAAYDSGRKAWKIALSTADMNGLDVHYNFALAGCIPIDFEIRTVAKFVSDLNDFNRLTEAVADVTLVATTTTNTDMVGTDGANTTTPPTITQISDKISTDMIADPTNYPVNVKEISDSAAAGTALKDFADTGYDPVTHKVVGVKLADLITAYTGNVPQTVDNDTKLTTLDNLTKSSGDGDLAAIKLASDINVNLNSCDEWVDYSVSPARRHVVVSGSITPILTQELWRDVAKTSPVTSVTHTVIRAETV